MITDIYVKTIVISLEPEWNHKTGVRKPDTNFNMPACPVNVFEPPLDRHRLRLSLAIFRTSPAASVFELRLDRCRPRMSIRCAQTVNGCKRLRAAFIHMIIASHSGVPPTPPHSPFPTSWIRPCRRIFGVYRYVVAVNHILPNTLYSTYRQKY